MIEETRVSSPGRSRSSIESSDFLPLETRPRLITRERILTSILPPETRQIVFLPWMGSLRARMAARPVAPAPSAISF